jgi:hypothetical protein
MEGLMGGVGRVGGREWDFILVVYYLIPMRFDVMEIKFKSNHSTVMLDTTARLLA